MKIVLLFLSMAVAVHGQSVGSMSLMNADTNLPIDGFDPIPDGAVLDMNSLYPGTNLTVEAFTTGSVASVKFDFAGRSRTEGTSRWLMCGNNNDDLFRCDALRVGFSGIIKATPYAGRNARGRPGTSLSVRLTIVRSAELKLTVVESPSNEEIGPLFDKTIIDLETTPTVNVHASLDDRRVDSVVFTLDGVEQPVENNEPYELFNSVGAGFTPWEPSIGHHTLMVVAYSGPSASGTVLANTTVKFRVLPRIPLDDGYYDDDDEYGDDDGLYFNDDDTVVE